LNYQLYSEEDGSKIEDTVGDYPRPLIFQTGKYQVSKCLDIAVQQMRAGEEGIAHCPNDLDIGGGI
jgi:FKBP-type peptidyl-prolyl cis-trans isomerase 2